MVPISPAVTVAAVLKCGKWSPYMFVRGVLIQYTTNMHVATSDQDVLTD